MDEDCGRNVLQTVSIEPTLLLLNDRWYKQRISDRWTVLPFSESKSKDFIWHKQTCSSP